MVQNVHNSSVGNNSLHNFYLAADPRRRTQTLFLLPFGQGINFQSPGSEKNTFFEHGPERQLLILNQPEADKFSVLMGDVGRFVRLFTFLPLKNILGP